MAVNKNHFSKEIPTYELQTEIPVQEGKTGINRIEQHRESDDIKAGGTEMFFLFLRGSRKPAGKGEKRDGKG